jgi:uncharacterized membrane protein YvbJ
MKCPHCQTENAEKAKFCKRCGLPLPRDVICTHCGHKNILAEKFCEQCGQTLVSGQTTKSAQMSPQPAPQTKPSPEPAPFAGGRY